MISVRETAGLVGAALWVVAPIVGVAALREPPESTANGGDREWAPVGRSQNERIDPVSLSLVWAPPVSLFAPGGLDGLVEDVVVEPGQVLTTGAPILSVGGIERLAVVIDRPFTRPLQHGLAGPDVARLNGVLASLGLPADRGDRVGDATERGILELSRRVGASDTAVFDPSWVVFVPPDSTSVSKVLVQAGMMAPAQGEPLVEMLPKLAAATWAAPEGSASGPTVPENTEGSELRVSGKSVANLTSSNADDSGVTGDVLARLAAIVEPGAERADGTIVAATTAEAATIPASAVYSDATGGLCARWRSAEAGVSAVDVVESIAGDAVVVGLPADATEVQVNPPKSRRTPCR